jgi:hypothetical protein
LTNREKAIASLTEWFKLLNNESLAFAVVGIPNADFVCQHCIHGTSRGKACKAKGTCEEGVKQWLEQEES